MNLVVLDTDVASRLIRGRDVGRLRQHLAGHRLAVTFVTQGELTAWALGRRWDLRSLDRLHTFLDDALILGYDPGVATRWGYIQAFARRRGRPRPDNDTWIAACCLERGVPLATFNAKDFRDFAEHDGLVLVA